MTSRESEFQPKYAIASAGAAVRSLIGKLPRQNEDLGPIVGVSVRVASRTANSLRAGYPARGPEELNPFRIVLFHSPPEHMDSLMRVVLSERVEWNGKALVLCDCDAGPEWIAQLQARGASVAVAREFGIPGYLTVEGEGSARNAANRLARDLGMKAIEVPPGTRHCFDAALTLATGAFTPLIDRAAALLRQAGVREAEAARLATSLFQKTAADYLHSGRQSWSWYTQSPPVADLQDQIAVAAAAMGDGLGRALRQLILLGLEAFEKHPDAAAALTHETNAGESQP